MFLSIFSNRGSRGEELPYIWVQGAHMLVRRVAYMFHSM